VACEQRRVIRDAVLQLLGGWRGEWVLHSGS
jgi:hypothetical protein